MAELIRSYVQASTQLPRSQWRRRLSSLGKHIWTDLTHQPTYSGVFRYDIEEAAWYYGADPSDVDNILELFVEHGKILRDADYIFVVDFVNFQNYSPPSYRAMEKELEKLEATDGAALAAVAMQRYSNATPSPQQRNTIHTPKAIRDDTKRNKTRRDKSAELHSARLAELESNLSSDELLEWQDFKAIEHNNYKHKDSLKTMKVIKHLERILAEKEKNKLSDDAICYGLQQAVMAEADNHTYVLRAARSHKPGSYTKRDPVAIVKRPGEDEAWRKACEEGSKTGRRVEADGTLWDGDKIIEHTPEEIAAIKRNLGLALKSPTTI